MGRYGDIRGGTPGERAFTVIAMVGVAVDETASLPHPPLPSTGAAIVIERGRQRNNRLVGG